MMEPVVVATRVGLKLVTAYLKKLGARNNESLERERVELALDWGVELKQALPLVLSDLEARFERLDSKIEEMLSDRQLARIYTNFTYEAAREAIDERRRMLAHAAIGLLNPEMSVERKARIERTLRQLDPVDVLSLWGVDLVVDDSHEGTRRAKLLFDIDSGDALLASGCVRIRAVGGGLGAGASTGADVTRTGHDVLTVLRSYLAARRAPFEVPGREIGPNDRSEADARKIIDTIPVFANLGAFLRRRSTESMRRYSTPRSPDSSARLDVYLHEWQAWMPQLEQLATVMKDEDVDVELQTQPYQPEDGQSYDILRFTLEGPHDLLRYLADDLEATWTR